MNKEEEINYGLIGFIGFVILSTGLLLKLLYVGTNVDSQSVSEMFGTNVHGNKLAILAILLLKFGASSWGYILCIVVGSYIFITSIISSIKNK